MRILVLGGDGYLGWPTALRFSGLGHEVAIVDNMSKRLWEAEVGVTPLFSIPPSKKRVEAWEEVSGKRLQPFVGDIAVNHRFVYKVFELFRPDVVVHYAEQPSAPYSMVGREYAVEKTQINNVAGTLNVLFAMKAYTPKAHLVKLGTMGEYGTPDIDIEEGFIEIQHRGRRDVLPFPKQAGSFYHLSKVHDSHNIAFVCRVWGLRATDLNQGVVYGIQTQETELDPRLVVSFHYDHVFGTVLNRFCVQAVLGHPLTVYGSGGQKRGFLNIRDTLACVELAVSNPPVEAEYRVFNQFTEVFSVKELARTVREESEKLGWSVTVKHISNPRLEKEEHYYNPRNDKLLSLGLKPVLLSEELVQSMLVKIANARDAIDPTVIPPTVKWRMDL